jgi:hypothetical protein
MVQQRFIKRNFLLKPLLSACLFLLAMQADGRLQPPFPSGIARDSAYVQVYVRFTVAGKTGAIEDAHIIKTVKHCDTCSAATVAALEQEALRTVKSMPPWKKSGKNRKIVYDLPIKVLIEPKE